MAQLCWTSFIGKNCFFFLWDLHLRYDFMNTFLLLRRASRGGVTFFAERMDGVSSAEFLLYQLCTAPSQLPRIQWLKPSVNISLLLFLWLGIWEWLGLRACLPQGLRSCSEMSVGAAWPGPEGPLLRWSLTAGTSVRAVGRRSQFFSMWAFLQATWGSCLPQESKAEPTVPSMICPWESHIHFFTILSRSHGPALT